MKNGSSKPLGLVCMGPAGCGKTFVAESLSKYFGCPFVDADSIHSESNVQKMSSGIPLTDEERIPWLHQVREAMLDAGRSSGSSTMASSCPVRVVTACSALKKSYRDILRGHGQTTTSGLEIIFIFLDAGKETLIKRISERKDHFMKPHMLESQLKTLERPGLEEINYVFTVDAESELSSIIQTVAGKVNQLIVN